MEKLSIYGNLEIDGNYHSKSELIDLYRLQKQLLIELDLIASLEECSDIWQGYSSDLAASWLGFPKEDIEIIKYIMSNSYFVSFENYLNN